MNNRLYQLFMSSQSKRYHIICRICGEDFDWRKRKYTYIRITNVDDPSEWDSKKIHMHEHCKQNIPRCSGPCNRERRDIPGATTFTARYSCNPTLKYTCLQCLENAGEINCCTVCGNIISSLSKNKFRKLTGNDDVLCEDCQTLTCMICQRKIHFEDEYIIVNARVGQTRESVMCLPCQKEISEYQPEKLYQVLPT